MAQMIGLQTNSPHGWIIGSDPPIRSSAFLFHSVLTERRSPKVISEQTGHARLHLRIYPRTRLPEEQEDSSDKPVRAAAAVLVTASLLGR